MIRSQFFGKNTTSKVFLDNKLTLQELVGDSSLERPLPPLSPEHGNKSVPPKPKGPKIVIKASQINFKDSPMGPMTITPQVRTQPLPSQFHVTSKYSNKFNATPMVKM